MESRVGDGGGWRMKCEVRLIATGHEARSTPSRSSDAGYFCTLWCGGVVCVCVCVCVCV